MMLVMAVVVGQSVLATDKKPLIAGPVVEKAIRHSLRTIKQTGELTKSDLERVNWLALPYQITDAGLKELAKCKQLSRLFLFNTKATKVGVSELEKALPRCRIYGP